jgi:dienelactone hydrolase
MKRKMFNNIIIVLMVITVLAAQAVPVRADEEFAVGKIVDKVICKADPTQSYALYLPPGYSKDQKRPILYAFDPAARGRLPVELFKPAAEKYGYIVVGSNNSRNGPGDVIHRAIWAMWRDTRARFAIDEKRIYATGFSGGARVASVFHVLTKKACAGIIACGAGLSPAVRDAAAIKPAAWYGIIGLADFNYREIMGLDKTLDEAGVDHHVHVLETDHRWPPQEACTVALEWMEILAIKKGTAKKNDAVIRDIYQKALSRAYNLEMADKTYFAAEAYDSAHSLFKGLSPKGDTPALTHAEEKKNRLKNTDAYKTFQKEEEKRLQEEEEYVDNFKKVIRAIEMAQAERLSLRAVIRELGLDDLLKEAAKKEDIYNSSLAYRLLFDLNLNVGQVGGVHLQKGGYDKAIIYFEIFVKTGIRKAAGLYNLACAHSLNKQKKKALKYLKMAVDEGFTNRDHMEKDKDLDYIRNEKAFKQLMESLAKKE